MKRYFQASEETHGVFAEAMERFHEELAEVEVTVQVLAVADLDSNGTHTGRHAVTHRGYPAAATVRRTTARERAMGARDVLVEVDELAWAGMDDAQRLALADHELQHLELKLDDEGRPTVGPDLRPVLTTRKHDAEVGVFYDVIERHGKASVDAQVVDRLRSDVAAVEVKREVAE